MRKLLVRIGKSRTLKLVAAGVALLAGVDDLIELYGGLEDVFGLDVAHGVAFMAVTGILEPLTDLIRDTSDPLTAIGEDS